MENMEQEPVEQSEAEKPLDVNKLVGALVKVLGEEAREDFAGLDFQDALGLGYGLLLELGIDPDAFLLENDIES